MTDSRKVAAIIVVYAPPQAIDLLHKSLQTQVDEIIIVDNADNEPLAEVHWVKNAENNLAKAQNLGIAKARELSCTHVLLLDDDSLPAATMVSQLLKAHKKHPNAAVIGPYLHEDALGKPPKYIQPKGSYFFQRVGFDDNTPFLQNLYYVAASGSLIPMEIFDHIGEMKEDFCMYFVDTEFCLRARAAGFDIIAVREATMQHRFGKRSSHRLMGKTISTTNHAASSRYYMFRNRRHLWLNYFETNAGYVFFDILRAQSEAIRVLLYEKHKAEKLQAMVKGLFSR